MRTAFGHLVHTAHRQSGRLDDPRGAGGGHHLETEPDQITSDLFDVRLVVFAHAEERATRGRQDFASAQLGLGKGFGKAVAYAHHLTGGLHLRTEDGIDAGELGEREYRFLDAVVGRDDFASEADFLQRLASHHARRNLGQRLANALGNERHRTRSTRIDLEHVDIFALHGHLYVHQAYHVEFQGHLAHLVTNLVLNMLRQRVGRKRAGRVTGVDTGLLDVLHDAADDDVSTVADRVDIHFDGAVEEVIQQYRAVVGHLDRFTHIALEFLFLVDDLHRPAAQHVGRAHHQRVADRLGRSDGFLLTTRRGVLRLTQIQTLHHLLKAFTVFGAVDCIRTSADDRYTRLLQRTADLQRGLPAILHNHALGLLDTDDFQHVFQGYRLEVQAVGRVVVGGDGFRVAVDHDGLVAVFAHRQRGVHTAVVELDALSDTVGAATQDHDFVAARRVGLALFLVGRIHVGRVGSELGGAGVDALVDRQHLELVTVAAQVLLGDA